jgi:hypothetical protein
VFPQPAAAAPMVLLRIQAAAPLTSLTASWSLPKVFFSLIRRRVVAAATMPFTRKTWIVGQILSFQASNKRVCKILWSWSRLSKGERAIDRLLATCDTWKSLQFSLSLACVFALLLHGALEKASPVKTTTLGDSNPQPARRLPTGLTYQLIRKSEPDLPNSC